jgi:hypothetical protein
MTVKKPNLVDVIGAVVTAAVTAKVAVNLADHSVGVLILVSVVLSMLASGLTLTGRLAKAVATEVVRCSTAGCPFEFRARRSHSPERMTVLRELVADHGRHGSAGV